MISAPLVEDRLLKFPSFAYAAPTSVDEALATLRGEPEAQVLAGGQSLLPLLAQRRVGPSLLVDLGQVETLRAIELGTNSVRIGSMVTHATSAGSSLIRENLPLLADAAALIGSEAVRQRGTLGGSLAHGDPSAELPLVAVAMGATMVLRGAGGERRLNARDFFVGPFETAIARDELLVCAEFPVRAHRFCLEELARRPGGTALVSAAVGFIESEGLCMSARVALSGVAATPHRSTAAEGILEAKPLNEEIIEVAAEAAAAALDPPGDLHGSGPYRRQLARVAVARALKRCLAEGRR